MRRHELWDGWSVTLPGTLRTTRNADGSWSAWDATHVLDVHIITVGGKQDGSALSAEEMLGNDSGEPLTLEGASGRVSRTTDMTDTANGPQLLEWTHLRAASQNTMLSLSVTNSGGRDAPWHDAAVRGVTHRA